MSLQASGRGWKVPGERAGSLRNPLLSSSWDKKMADKAAAQQFKAVKKAALDAYKEKKQVRPLDSSMHTAWWKHTGCAITRAPIGSI